MTFGRGLPARDAVASNMLFFDADGGFLAAFADLNRFSGKPLEIPFFQYTGPLQLVIAKAGSGGEARRLRYVMFFDLQHDEYNEPLARSIYGHAAARGATAVAAYDPFRPFLPEEFTSVGGYLPVYWDSQGNRYPRTSIRRAPQVAAADDGNTTFFVVDTPADADTQPNFFGTSAAAPHAAAIGALVLQANGGGRSLSPAELRGRLQGSTFRHDLDPMFASARGPELTITASGDQGNESKGNQGYDSTTAPGAMDDRDFFTIRYHGRGSIVRLTLDGASANPSGLPGPGARSAGMVFDPRPFLGAPFADEDPGLFEQGFPFTVGAVSGGLQASDVTASFSRPRVGNATAQQYQQMTLTFRRGLSGGQALVFGIDRDEAVTGYPQARDGNGADVLGDVALFPQRRVLGSGLRFQAELSDGRAIRGRLRNRIGRGWTPVDGYGLIDAERAVEGR